MPRPSMGLCRHGWGADMTISKLRGHLYAIAKIAGDVQALTHRKPGTAIPKRIGRRIAGYLAGRGIGSIFKPTK